MDKERKLLRWVRLDNAAKIYPAARRKNWSNIYRQLHQPNMQPINNIEKNIVYSGSKQNVKMTVVDGKILYEDGKFNIGVSAEEVYAKANEIIDRMRG